MSSTGQKFRCSTCAGFLMTLIRHRDCRLVICLGCGRQTMEIDPSTEVVR